MLMVMPVEACVLTYDEYKETEIQHAYIIGDYVFNMDEGYSPSLYDIAIAARSIPETEEEYILDVYNIPAGNGKYEYEKWNIFEGGFDTNPRGFKVDVTWEYWANIVGATEDEYDMFICMVGDCDIKVNYTTLETVGEGEYKTSATRTVQVEGTNKIKEAYYCLTPGETCEPNQKATINADGTFEVDYPTSISGNKVCVKAVDEYGNFTDVICDDKYVLVDGNSASAKATEVLGTVIEKEPNPLDELFDVTYSVSGGETIYYYYTEENGEKVKNLLTDLSDLPEGEIEVEVKVIGGNGLVTTETRVITVKKHKVTYDYKTNGGESSDIEEYKASYKGKAKLNEKAYKSGYEFIGWSLDKDGTTGITSLVVEEDVTLYAIFKGNIGANFKIKTKDGSIPATTENERVECEVYNNTKECKVEVPTLNAKVGYEALGWSSEEYSKTAELFGGEEMIIQKDATYYSVTRSKTGKTATFNTIKDGEIYQEILKCYPYNGETSCTIDPSGVTSEEYKGKEFLGFTEDPNDLKPATDFELESGKEYYAYYKDKYTITYKTGRGEISTEEAGVSFVVDDTGIIETVEEKTIQEPAEIEGWEFVGYRTDEEEGEARIQPGEKVKVKGNITYNAVYKKKNTVTYLLDDDVTGKPKNEIGYAYYYSGSGKEVKYETRIAEIDNLEKASHTFITWLKDGEEIDPGTKIVVEGNVVITAKWDVNGCVVYFDYATNGGESADKSSITYIEGDESIDLTKITAYKTGWEFIGWTDKLGANSNALTVYKPEETENDVTLYAMYKKTVRVDYEIQDGNAHFSLGINSRQEYAIYNSDKSAKVEMPEINTINANYEFLGWTDEKGGIEAKYQPGEEVEVSTYKVFYTVTRQKKAIESTYHYLDEDGNGAYEKRGCYLYNGNATCNTTSTIEESVVNGAVLNGWSSNATQVKKSAVQTISKNTEFYGVYDKVVRATFYSGMNKASSPVVTNAIEMIVSPSGTTYVSPNIMIESPDGITGYTTQGWRQDEEAGEAVYKAGDNYQLTKDVEFYGVYTRNITISYVSNGGTTTPASESKKVYYNTALNEEDVKAEFTLADKLTKEGYTFQGWLVENSGSLYEANSKIEIKKNTKMYASYKTNSYKVTYNYEANGGESVSVRSANVAYLGSVDLSVTAYKSGYEFVGWSKEANSTKIVESVEMPSEDITLYAVYRKAIEATWVLTDENAGNITTNKTTCYMYNESANCKIGTGSVEVNEGYEITGWTENQGDITVQVSNNSQTGVSENKVYYSISRETDPNVGTFYYPQIAIDEETGETLEEIVIGTKTSSCYLYNGAKKCTITEPIKPTNYEGGVFDGWTYEKDKLTTVEYEINEDKNYYSHFTSVIEIKYHDGSNNTELIDTKELEYILAENGDNKNEPTFTLRKPTEFDDYKEIGWTTNGEAIVNVGDYQSLSNLTTDESYELYGVYARDLKIEYDSNGSPNKQETQKQTQNYHSFLGQTEHEFTIANAIKRTGYTYVNWARGSISGTRTAPGTKVKIEEHKKYFAIWDVNEFNIQYDYNDGVISGNTTSKSEYDKEIKLEIPTKIVTISGSVNGTGATVADTITKETPFAGWELTGDFTTAEYSEDGTNYNKWTDNTLLPKATSVKNLNPNDGGNAKLTAKYEDVTVTLPSITKTGFTCYWNTKADGTGTRYASLDTFVIKSETSAQVNLYGICDAHSYTIVFNKNNSSATGTMSNQKAYYGQQVVLTNNDYALDGYQMLGWSLTANGSVKYKNMETVKNLTPTEGGTVTLYAIWTPAIDLNELKYMEKPDHTHIWVSKYTEAEHWQECNVCGAEKADSRHTHTMVGSGNKYLARDQGGNAYKESCTCGKTTGPQIILFGEPEQYTSYSYVGSPAYLYMSQIKQITYAEFISNHYEANCGLVGGKYKWFDYDGDGYGHVFANALYAGDSYSGSDVIGTIEMIYGTEGDKGNKDVASEYYAVVVYANQDSTPTKGEYATWLRNKVNSSANPTDHALYGYAEKYANGTDAQFNRLVSYIRNGDTILTNSHIPYWSCGGGAIQRLGNVGLDGGYEGHYLTHSNHHDSNKKSSVGWYGPAGTCDVCGLYFDGLADTYTDWQICNAVNDYTLRTTPGHKHTCGGHGISLGGQWIGTIYCNYRNDNGTIKVDWSVTTASGWSYTESLTSEYTIPKYNGSSLEPYDYPNLITFTNGTLSKGRHAGTYYALNDTSVPTAYNYTNATTNNTYWQVINNGTASNPSTQPQVKVTFRDLAQFSNNTMRVRVLDSDKSTVIKQANGNEWVPLSIISGKNGTDGSEVLWQTTLNVPTEVDGSKNVYIQAQDATGNYSEMIPMQISYVDYSGPEITLSLDTNAWSPYKTLTVTVDDIHDVYLGVFKDDMINVSNSTYNNKRTYVFNGDMYETNYVTVYALDSLGNLSYKTIKVSDIDSASPNINKVSISGKTITISADDLNATINEVGSGISHYGYIKNGSEGDITWATTNVITLPSKGTYLIYTKDKAGNISDPYQVEIQN